MAKLSLNTVGNLIDTTTAQTTINTNNAATVTAVNNTLSLDGTAPNQMLAPFDMNSQQILNLPAPATTLSPLRLQDLNSFIGGGTIATVPTGGTTGQGLTKHSNANYDMQWSNVDTSVGLAMPTDFTITNSPVTGSGTLTAAYAVTPTGSGSFVKQTSPTLVTPNLGTPSAINLANATNMAISNVGGLGTGVASTLASPINAASGIVTFSGALGTPTSGTLTSVTGLPISTGVSGLGTGVATALTVNTGTAGSHIVNGGVLGTPSSGTLTNCTIPATGLTGTTLPASVVTSSLTTLGTSPTITTPNIVGRTNAGNATAGNVGEFIQSIIASGSAVTMTTGTATTITTISLTAGDWDVWGLIFFTPGVTTNITQLIGGLSLATNTLPLTADRVGITAYGSGGVVPGVFCGIPMFKTRINVSATTSIFLVGNPTFTVSTLTAWGSLQARRVQS